MLTEAEVLERALELPSPQRASIARELLKSLEPDDEGHDIDEAWSEEIERRATRYERGEVQALEASEVFERAFRMLKTRATMTLRFLPEADAELIEAAQWYEDRQTGVGVRFIAAAIDASVEISNHPLQYGRPPGLKTSREVRRKLPDEFPYSMIYEVLDSEILILALSHVRRRPGYWRKRKLTK